jgi:hypothetical protein
MRPSCSPYMSEMIVSNELVFVGLEATTGQAISAAHTMGTSVCSADDRVARGAGMPES